MSRRTGFCQQKTQNNQQLQQILDSIQYQQKASSAQPTEVGPATHYKSHKTWKM